MTGFPKVEGLPSIEAIRAAVSYDPKTGMLRHKATNRPAFQSTECGGYKRGWALGQRFLAHRIAFAIYHGRWPRGFIDHINLDKSDNRIGNLREVTKSQNCANSRPRRNSKSRFIGVTKQVNRWRAQLSHMGKVHYLGSFVDDEQAALAYDRKAVEVWGEHASLNFPERRNGFPGFDQPETDE